MTEGEEGEREKASIIPSAGSLPQMFLTAGVGQAEVKSLALYPCLHQWQVLKYLRNLLLPPTVHISRKLIQKQNIQDKNWHSSMGCVCPKWWLNPLQHNGCPGLSFIYPWTFWSTCVKTEVWFYSLGNSNFPITCSSFPLETSMEASNLGIHISTHKPTKSLQSHAGFFQHTPQNL